MNRSDPSDLGQRLLAGDEDVLEAILRSHGPSILALLRQRCGAPLTQADCEDVLAAALFRLWQHRSRFDPSRASLRVWFFRIAENLARDVLKHGWQKARQLERSTATSILADVAERPASWSEGPKNNEPAAHATAELLRELLKLLPETQRRIVLADANSRDGTAASHDLANELGIPASTVRVYRRRALERLRREIELRGMAIQGNSRH